MRNLATIQTISNIEPIEGADKIERATCLGWHIVVKKDEFKVGDKCVYIEIDSIVPKENPVFSFLAPRKYRVKTIKLRGQISQGLCLPLSLVPQLSKYQVGDDVTDILKIKKYDPELTKEKETVLQSKKRSYLDIILSRFKIYRDIKAFTAAKKQGFPSSIISKSDETRIQSIPGLLEDIKGKHISITEKLDGQSYTASLERKRFFGFSFYRFIVASRNLKVNLNQINSYTEVTKKYQIKDILLKVLKNENADSVAIQGEICGPKIQGNKYKFKENNLFLFKVQINTRKIRTMLSPKKLVEFGHLYNIPVVPYLGEIEWNPETSHSLDPEIYNKPKLPKVLDVDFLVGLSSSGKSKINPDIKREGFVCREENNNYEFSFKVINPEFLLDFED